MKHPLTRWHRVAPVHPKIDAPPISSHLCNKYRNGTDGQVRACVHYTVALASMGPQLRGSAGWSRGPRYMSLTTPARSRTSPVASPKIMLMNILHSAAEPVVLKLGSPSAYATERITGAGDGEGESESSMEFIPFFGFLNLVHDKTKTRQTNCRLRAI